jgi:hypothetical protein
MFFPSELDDTLFLWGLRSIEFIKLVKLHKKLFDSFKMLVRLKFYHWPTG